ncbi:CLUMA_CG012535, isoform A [Clunio marinus]|uniref:CLUMA_CG012535, isoform A n=1 Tax=Clunio marinus TaxID=568069 RepID=A0A1J1IG71_9DIPT|nr:CLUMA_CG012535, isoform A [Clunio marinus]
MQTEYEHESLIRYRKAIITFGLTLNALHSSSTQTQEHGTKKLKQVTDGNCSPDDKISLNLLWQPSLGFIHVYTENYLFSKQNYRIKKRSRLPRDQQSYITPFGIMRRKKNVVPLQNT